MPLTSTKYIYEKIHGHPVASSKGVVLQHRRVWFEANGPIPEGLIVHHINGNKADNRIENLQLLDRSSHMKEHFPNGFHFKAWNKGVSRMRVVECSVCGERLLRKASELKKAENNGYRTVCSVVCRSVLRHNKPKDELARELPKYYTKHKSGKFQVIVKGKYIGVYETEELAKEAVRNARGESK